MTLFGNARVVWSLVRGQGRAPTHAARLDAFYGPQAERYDALRERLLHGRDRLFGWIGAQLTQHAYLVELGAGTGRNLAFLGGRLDDLARVDLVDLCAPMLEQARRRWEKHDRVHAILADACDYRPEQPADAVVMAYSLSMIPDWYAAVDNAIAMLRPGGLLGIADFYVARRNPPPGSVRHGLLVRHFWPLWFDHEGVFPSADHLPYLASRLEILELHEARGSLPYVPLLRVPYYLLLGRKLGGPPSA